MYTRDPLHAVHVELSTRCLLECPACPRTLQKGTYSVGDLPLDLLKKSYPPGSALRFMNFCGNHGDPIYHAQFHNVLSYCGTHAVAPGGVIAINTNGSGKSEAWWRKTAEIARPLDVFIFAIDGLADTNHIYRRNADWDSIWLGLTTLKKYGRCAIEWKWIVFKQNQLQTPDAYRIAKELGVKFVPTLSNRYWMTPEMTPDLDLDTLKEMCQWV